MDYSKIKNEIKLKKVTIEDVATEIGMSRTGLQLALKNDTLTVSALEKISNVLGVPVYYWFSDNADFAVSETRRVFNALEKIVIKELNKI